MSDPAFEELYQDKLWRVAASEFRGRRRLAIWAHYRDRETGDWKPCGGSRRDAPGFMVPVERLPELEAAIAAIREQLRSGGG